MPRTPRKKETKNAIINEEVKQPDPEPVAEHRNCLMHEKQSFSSHQPEPEPEPEPPRPVIDEDYRLTMNNLARKEMQQTLLRDILTDMHICKLEGWSHRDYLIELKNLIDGLIDKQSL